MEEEEELIEEKSKGEKKVFFSFLFVEVRYKDIPLPQFIEAKNKTIGEK